MTWINTYVEIDIESGEVLRKEGFHYDGPVAEAKRDREKEASARRLEEQTKMEKDAYGRQKELMDTLLKPTFSKYLTEDMGFSPETQALLEAGAIEDVSDNFDDAQSAVKTALMRRGTASGPVSGDYGRAFSGLFSERARTLADAIRGLRVQNAMQGVTNRFNAGNILSGNAATLNSPIATFNAGGNNALSNMTQLATAPGFGSFLAQGLGQGLGSALTGGFSNIGRKIFGGGAG